MRGDTLKAHGCRGLARCLTRVPVSTAVSQGKDHSAEQGCKAHLRLVGVSRGPRRSLFVTVLLTILISNMRRFPGDVG